jgi:predicted acyl esterase
MKKLFRLPVRAAVCAILAVLLASAALAGPMFSRDLRTTVGVSEYHEVPMTDGTLLATDVYLPDSSGGPWPVILIRNTYTRNMGLNRYLNDGYAAVVQAPRGLHGSGGKASAFYYDGWREGLTDGATPVAWIKKQPWCNGKIGTTGESALALVQMLMAPVTRDIAAQYIYLTPANFYFDVGYPGGVFRKNLVEGWLTLLGQYDVSALYRSHPVFDDFWSYYNVVARAKDITAPRRLHGRLVRHLPAGNGGRVHLP